MTRARAWFDGRRTRRAWRAIAGLACAGALSACGGSTSLRITSDDAQLTQGAATAFYSTSDPNTADIFISDFPPDLLTQRLHMGAAGPAGTLTHIHLFVEPEAGKTPIDFGATSATVRYLVFTGSSIGVYGGGGFLLPSDSIGDTTLAGRIENGTLRLISSGDGFTDRLGLAEISGRVSATRDDERARAVRASLTRLLSTMPR